MSLSGIIHHSQYIYIFAGSSIKSLSVTQHFPVVLFILLRKMIPTFESFPKCDINTKASEQVAVPF